MAIDPSIALGLRPPEQPSQLNMLAQALQVQGLQRQNQLGAMQMRDSEAAAAEKQALRNYLGGANLDTPEGEQGLYRVAPTQAGGILKDRLGVKKTATDIKKTEQETLAAEFKLRQEKVTQNLQTLSAVSTPQQAAQWMQGGVASGLITPEQAQAELAQVPADPQGFAQWKQSQQMAGMTLAQQMDQQWKAKDFGLSQDKFAETKRSNKVQEGISAGNLGVARANLGLRKQELEAGGGAGKPPAGYRWGAGGALEFIPGGPADPANKRGGEPTEDEKRSAGLAVRMEAALKKVNEVTATNKGAAKPEVTAELLRGVPGVGEPLANVATSEDRQRVDTAQIDALDAALTLATGAAYTKEQLRGLSKSYFPQIGDDAKTVADKEERLRTVIESARIRAGRSSGAIDAALTAGGKPSGASYNDPDKERRYQEWKAKQGQR